MTTLDDEILPEVFAALDEYGTDMVFTDKGRVNSPTTGSVTTTPIPYTRKASPMVESDRWKGRTLEQGAKAQTIIAAQGLTWTPKKGMTVVPSSGVTYVVEDIDTIYSGDSVAAYGFLLQGQGS